MQLFSTQLNDIQTQIEALQAERNRLEDLESATASALANLKAVVANVEGDEEAIATLKSAINDLFSVEETYICGDCGNDFLDNEMVEGEDVCINCGETEGSKFGTPERPCPATSDKAQETIQYIKERQESQSQVEGDKTDCSVTVVDEPEEKATPQFKKMFDGEPEPDEDDVVFYSDQVNRYENTLNIHFKLKRDSKKWAEQFEMKYHDCKVEVGKDEYGGFNYVLQVIKGNPNDPQWWETVTQFDYSKSPEENRKSGVQQKPTQIEPLPSDVVDEEIEPPAFSFMATGMGWLNVVHDGNVLGVIYSNPSGWELENGDVFSTREEAATALFQSTSIAA